MPDIKNITLSLQGSSILIFLLIFTGILTIYFMYRNTTPPVQKWKKNILAVVRLIALVLIIFLVFSPIITITREININPGLALLIDNSSSIVLMDKDSSNRKQLQEFLGRAQRDNRLEKYDMNYFSFGHNITEIGPGEIDSMYFDKTGTDISNALTQLFENERIGNLKNIILISDGIYNFGRSPEQFSRDVDVPIYTIGIGDASFKKDIMISNIHINEIAYLNDDIPLSVDIQSYGYADRPVEVVLSANDNVIESKIVNLPAAGLEKRVEFVYSPDEAKVYNLKISLSEQTDEITEVNNYRDIYLKVLDNQVRILLVSGSPNQDYAFLKRSLEQNPDYYVTGVVQKGNDLYFADLEDVRNNIGNHDVYILIDFPKPGLEGFAGTISREILENKKPALYIRGEVLNSQTFNIFPDIFNIRNFFPRGSEEEVYIKLEPAALDHPICRISESYSENLEFWSMLPPVFCSAEVPIPGENAEIIGKIDLLKTTGSSFTGSTPLIYLNKLQGRKSIFFNIYNIWRWKFMALRERDIENFYDLFFVNCINWLINKEDSKIFSISTNNDFYESGEKIIVNSQVYTENYLPVDDAHVQINIGKEGTSLNRIMQSVGNGRYSVPLDILESGEYTITGQADKNNRILGTDSKKIIINDFNMESVNTIMDTVILKRISNNTGGYYFNLNESDNIYSYLDIETDSSLETIDYPIHNKGWLLTFIVILLCFEWFIRKRAGML
ncbi:hypothetical protein ACFL7D_03370 [candidate division KSB1 bacterium]